MDPAPPEFVSDVERTDRPFPHERVYIPADTAQVHASNLLLLENGDLLCAWFGGSQEGKSDISIYSSRLPAGSRSWTAPQKLTHDEKRSEQNPLLFQSPSGAIWLLHTAQNHGDQDSAIVRRRISTDGAQTWGPSQDLITDPGTFIRQPIVVLDNGTLVLPVFKCRTEPGTRWVGNDDISCIRTSNDGGNTWSETTVPNSFGAVHMEIRRLKDRSYLAMYRSRWADNIYMSTSPDGLAWSEPKPTTLPNPNAGICFDVLSSGRILCVYNHSSKENATSRREGLYDDIAEKDDTRSNQAQKHAGKEAFWGAPRAPLCLAWSDDQGNTWNHRVLEEGDGFCLTNNSEKKLNRELSYPSMALGKNGVVHVAFTFWRQRIKYVRFKETDFCI